MTIFDCVSCKDTVHPYSVTSGAGGKFFHKVARLAPGWREGSPTGPVQTIIEQHEVIVRDE